jgi:hypothetical protein
VCFYTCRNRIVKYYLGKVYSLNCIFNNYITLVSLFYRHTFCYLAFWNEYGMKTDQVTRIFKTCHFCSCMLSRNCKRVSNSISKISSVFSVPSMFLYPSRTRHYLKSQNPSLHTPNTPHCPPVHSQIPIFPCRINHTEDHIDTSDFSCRCRRLRVPPHPPQRPWSPLGVQRAAAAAAAPRRSPAAARNPSRCEVPSVRGAVPPVTVPPQVPPDAVIQDDPSSRIRWRGRQSAHASTTCWVTNGLPPLGSQRLELLAFRHSRCTVHPTRTACPRTSRRSGPIRRPSIPQRWVQMLMNPVVCFGGSSNVAGWTLGLFTY